MVEVENTGEIQETGSVAAPHETEANQQSTLETAKSETLVQPDQQDNSWIKKLRRDRDEAIRREKEAERKAQIQEELLKQVMANQGQVQGAPNAEEDILAQIQKEEYVPGDKVAKALRKQQEDFKKELAELKKMQDQQYYARQEAEIRSSYSDYDDVVNADTLDLLKETNPKLAQRVANLFKVDPMDGATFAYETISSSGILDKIPGQRRAKEVEKKLEQNKKTVQSPQAFEKRPMAQAFDSNRLSEQQKKDLQKEMYHYASLGGGY